MTENSSPRLDPTKCRSGRHEWVPENIFTERSGKMTCRTCKDESRERWLRGESHPQNANHCRRGHSYTPENTKKKVKIVDGKKQIVRQCIQCTKDALKTSVR